MLDLIKLFDALIGEELRLIEDNPDRSLEGQGGHWDVVIKLMQFKGELMNDYRQQIR